MHLNSSFRSSSSFILRTSIRRWPIWSPSTYPWIPPIQNVNQALSYHPPYISPSLPIPPSTFHPCQFHISTGQHPIIHTLTLQMSKPPQSAMPHHICHTQYTQKTVQIHTMFSILQRHSAHPSHHHLLCPLQTTQIFFLHRPGFCPICQCTLDTSPVYLSLYVVWCTPSCQDRR